MKIAIHPRIESFSEEWVKFCKNNNIQFKIVDCYSNDIFDQMDDCDFLFWHWDHTDPAAVLFAKQLVYSLEKMGKIVFPDSNTCRLFDDKIGQIYFFKGVGAPCVPTYIYYNRKKAFEWLEQTKFPKVFKLSKGAGSENVKLVKNKRMAKKLINLAFRKGFKPIRSHLFELRRRMKRKKNWKEIKTALMRAPYLIMNKIRKNALMNKEKGYVYFQDLIPNNKYDIRVYTIGKKAVALKRLCRENDFRASGSGEIIYDKDQIDESCIKIAFDVSIYNNFQCMAYDFVFRNGQPLILEISYGVAFPAYNNCEGHWTSDLNWHNENLNICDEILKYVCNFNNNLK